MHIPPLPLFLLITRRRSSDLPNGSLGPTLNTLFPISHLALGLSLLSRRILLLAGLPQPLIANQIAQRFLRRAHSLVPAAVAALRVVCGGGARGRVGGHGTKLGEVVVAGVVFGFALGLGGSAGGLNSRWRLVCGVWKKGEDEEDVDALERRSRRLGSLRRVGPCRLLGRRRI